MAFQSERVPILETTSVVDQQLYFKMRIFIPVLFFSFALCSSKRNSLKRRLNIPKYAPKILKTKQVTALSPTRGQQPVACFDSKLLAEMNCWAENYRTLLLENGQQVPLHQQSFANAQDENSSSPLVQSSQPNFKLSIASEPFVDSVPADQTQPYSSSPVGQLNFHLSQSNQQVNLSSISNIAVPRSYSITLALVKEETEDRIFQSSFFFHKITYEYLYFGSDNLIDFLLFNYACSVCECSDKSEKQFDKKISFLSVDKIMAIFKTIPSSNVYFVPFYGIFYATAGKGENNLMSFKRRFPLYFVFTSISYFIQNAECESREIIKSLLSSIYSHLFSINQLESKKWKFLEEFLIKNYNISKKEIIKKQYRSSPFDICTVLFIYKEARLNERTRNFFSQVWSAGIQGCVKSGIEIFRNSKLIIVKEKDKKFNYFELTTRKLYQIEFTELLFNLNWKSIEDLLADYNTLRKYFNFAIDFRYRIFSGKDFEEFRKVVEQIESLLREYSSSNYSNLCEFFIELEHFIYLKCLLFALDFCREIETENCSDLDFSTIFLEFELIRNTLDRIHEILSSKKIQLISINFSQIYPNFKFISLKELSDNLLLIYWSSQGIELSDESRGIVKELIEYLKDFQYLKSDLGFLPKGLSRLRYAQYRDELKEIIKSNDEQAIEKVFFDDKYKELRRVWELVSSPPSNLSFEERKFYLEHLNLYLVRYNQ